jgi:hypothetical protein
MGLNKDRIVVNDSTSNVLPLRWDASTRYDDGLSPIRKPNLELLAKLCVTSESSGASLTGSPASIFATRSLWKGSSP